VGKNGRKVTAIALLFAHFFPLIFFPQDVLDLLEKIFFHCKNVSFLLTTRTSLESVLRRKFAGHTSVGVVSLDRKSSQMLVQELVPAADESECCRMA
jgi:hypothetical protein